MELKLEQKDAVDWGYRGEGAANLVLSYTGSSPDFIGKVLRIQKVPRNGTPESSNSVLTAEERLVWKEEKEMVTSPTKEMVDQLYVQLVMRPLLGPTHVDPGVRVVVSREFLEAIEKKTLSQRPAWRVEAAKIDTGRGFAILMSDHSLFPHDTVNGGPCPCLSVEIKPKCGFLPSSTFIADQYAFKRSTTRYRMHQLLKLHQHETSELSQYDPLDLFSGSKERIHKAIEDLYATPQNNFRVFVNGSLIFGGLGGGKKKTTSVIGDAFEEELKSFILAENGLRTESFMQLVAETVYSSGVLDQLLEVQRRDNFDIEGAIHAYYNIVSQPCAVCRKLYEAGLPNRCASLHSIPMDTSLKIVKDYLIAATAKDCSIIISYRPRVNGDFMSPYGSIHVPSTGQRFDYKVNFIDLDLKPLNKMEDYYKLDQKIVKCYAQILEMEHGGSNPVTTKVYDATN